MECNTELQISSYSKCIALGSLVKPLRVKVGPRGHKQTARVNEGILTTLWNTATTLEMSSSGNWRGEAKQQGRLTKDSEEKIASFCIGGLFLLLRCKKPSAACPQATFRGARI